MLINENHLFYLDIQKVYIPSVEGGPTVDYKACERMKADYSTFLLFVQSSSENDNFLLSLPALATLSARKGLQMLLSELRVTKAYCREITKTFSGM